MANYAAMNPGKYHLGVPFSYPPLENRRLREDYLIKTIKWKTSVLIGQRLYVGNVKIADKDNKERTLTDSIFKSKPGQFDSFTTDRRIDVAVNDGEEIVRLATYADRLLQFKQNTLHIINVTRSNEILEATHRFKGVSHHNAVCETDYGVAWCNAHGVYLYNGKQVGELLMNEGVRFISESKWASFYKEGETMIGFVPKTRQLLLIKGVSGTDTGDIMLFDMVTSSWTQGKARLGVEHKTNLVNMWDGKLVYGYESDTNEITIKPWKAEPSVVIDNFKVQTKEINFGNQSRKKVIKVRITYKGANGSNTNVLPKYAIDGGQFSHSFKDGNGTTITNIVGSSEWAEIDLYTDSNANNIRSFAIQLTDASGSSENVSSDFEINDITIIFRQKSVK
jgi:hypothetical protein